MNITRPTDHPSHVLPPAQQVLKWMPVAFLVVTVVLAIFGTCGILAHAHILTHFISMDLPLSIGLVVSSGGSTLASFVTFVLFLYKRHGKQSSPLTQIGPTPRQKTPLIRATTTSPAKTEVPLVPKTQVKPSSAMTVQEQEVSDLIDKAWELVKNISPHQPKFNDQEPKKHYDEARKILNPRPPQPTLISLFLTNSIPEKENSTTWEGVLVGRIKSLNDYLDRLYWKYEENLLLRNGGFEKPVKNNGDCLFEAFALSLPNDQETLLIKDHKSARQQAICWIKGEDIHGKKGEQKEVVPRYFQDTVLQYFLLESMFEHYDSLIRRLEGENSYPPPLSQDVTQKDLDQLKKSNTDKITAYKNILDSLLPAIDNAHLLAIKYGEQQIDGFKTIQASLISSEMYPYVEDYLKEVSKDGVYGGASELYALCSIAQKTAYVYRMSDSKQIQEDPYIKVCSEFQSNGILHFTHSGNHYNPWEWEKKSVPKLSQ